MIHEQVQKQLEYLKMWVDAEIEDEKQIAALRKDVHIDHGEYKIYRHANDQRKGLDQHIAGIAIVIGGTGDDDDAKNRCSTAEQQQKQIALAEKFPQCLRKFLHMDHTPFVTLYIIPSS